MQRSCSVVSCKNRLSVETRSRGITFHKFPRDPGLRSQWEAVLGQEGFVATDSSQLCSQHFRPQDIDRTGPCIRLKDGVTPSVFNLPWNPQRTESTTPQMDPTTERTETFSGAEMYGGEEEEHQTQESIERTKEEIRTQPKYDTQSLLKELIHLQEHVNATKTSLLTQTTAEKRLQEVNSKLQERIQGLKFELKKEKKAGNDSRKQFAEFRLELQEKIQQLQGDKNDLIQENKSLFAQMEQMRAQMQEKDTEMQSLKDKLSDLQNEMEETKEECQNHFQKIKDLELENQKCENPDNESTKRHQEINGLEEKQTKQETILEECEDTETEVPTAEPVELQTGTRTSTSSTDGRQTGGFCGRTGFSQRVGIAAACIAASTLALLAYRLF